MVFGITAKFVVIPVEISVNKKAKASENAHWNVPYSSEANTKLKLMVLTKGTKSNSNLVAFLEFIGFPVDAKIIDSRSASPVHRSTPSPRVVVFGPGALIALPVVKTIPSEKGKPDPF